MPLLFIRRNCDIVTIMNILKKQIKNKSKLEYENWEVKYGRSIMS